jgi:hypothetical protein
VAVVRPSGGFDGHFDVWVVHCIFIRYFEQNVRRPDEDQPKLIRRHVLLCELWSTPESRSRAGKYDVNPLKIRVLDPESAKWASFGPSSVHGRRRQQLPVNFLASSARFATK